MSILSRNKAGRPRLDMETSVHKTFQLSNIMEKDNQ